LENLRNIQEMSDLQAANEQLMQLAEDADLAELINLSQETEAENLGLAQDIAHAVHDVGDKVGQTIANGLCVYPTLDGTVFSAVYEPKRGSF